MHNNFLFYLSSFFSDRPVFQTKSIYNRELKVVFSNGKYLLNSGKANYSFGNLHTAFQQAFAKTNLKNKNIDHALILGFGAGSIAHILRNELKQNCKITGVEVDEKVIHIAEKFFHLAKLTDCKICVDDALNFLETNSEKFDLIAIDLFMEMEVPDKFHSESFLRLIANHMSKGASLYFNFVVDSRTQNLIFEEVEKKFQTVFPGSKTLNLMECNKVLFIEINPENQ